MGLYQGKNKEQRRDEQIQDEQRPDEQRSALETGPVERCSENRTNF